MNAKGNSTISPTLIQSIIVQAIESMQDNILNRIDIEVSAVYAEDFTKLDGRFLTDASAEIRALHGRYEFLTAMSADEKARVALQVGILIGRALPHSSGIVLGNSSERTVNR